MLFDLTGKKAFIIGKDGNFGPIFSESLKNANCKVLGIGFPEYDISKEKDRSAAVNFCFSKLGVPDIILCNAAIDIKPSQKQARFFDDFEKIIETNLSSYSSLAELLIPKMNGGVFVFIGSIQGYIGADWRNYTGGFEKPCAYNVSKAGLKQLARSITVQYGKIGIRAVCPGFGPYIQKGLPKEFTNKILRQIPMGRGVSAQDLKRTLLYACCCDGLAGEDWLVDGGYTKW